MKTRRDYHKQHISKGVRYVATCETCQREQLEDMAVVRKWQAYGSYFVRFTTIEGRAIETIGSKQPRYHGCQ